MQDKEPKWITFRLCRNNMHPSTSAILMNFKEIICKALPNMGRDHIVRLLMDPRHQSLLILENDKLIGGVCFRVHSEVKVAEVAFLAIKHDRRVQGFGQNLINHLKKQMQSKQVEFLITYGDNMALGFFRKQGFSEKLTINAEKLEGLIKEYDGGKLMECKIYPKVDYLSIQSIIKKQKQFVIQKIKATCINHVKFDGKNIPRDKTLDRKLPNGTVEHFKVDPRQIPGLIEGGWTFQEHDGLKQHRQKSLAQRCKQILKVIQRYPESQPFRKPVSLKDCPQYPKFISHPMDLSKMEKKVIKGEYEDEQSFCRDIQLILSNCRSFNHPSSIYYKDAVELERLISPTLEAFKNGIIETTK